MLAKIAAEDKCRQNFQMIFLLAFKGLSFTTAGELYDMGLDETKHVFRIAGKARLKPVSSATETS